MKFYSTFTPHTHFQIIIATLSPLALLLQRSPFQLKYHTLVAPAPTQHHRLVFFHTPRTFSFLAAPYILVNPYFCCRGPPAPAAAPFLFALRRPATFAEGALASQGSASSSVDGRAAR